MLQGFGLARLGRDAEVIETRDGNIVARLSLAFDVYAKGEKVTQWVEGSLWGKQAESLQEYLLKGKQVAVSLEDLRIETYQKADGAPMSKLVARVGKVGLAGDRQQSAAPRAPAPAPRPAPPPKTGTGFDDMDDDIPF